MNLEDLGLVPIDALIDELKKRFDYMVLSGMRTRGENRDDEHRHSWKGNVVMCQGLVTDAIRTMQDWAKEPADTDVDESAT